VLHWKDYDHTKPTGARIHRSKSTDRGCARGLRNSANSLGQTAGPRARGPAFCLGHEGGLFANGGDSGRRGDHHRLEGEGVQLWITPMAEHRTKPTASFLNYAPVPLRFGTSGVRGLVKDITDLEAYINVKAALRYLLSIGDIHADSTVVIAGGLRPSADRIMRACAQAIVDSVCQVGNAGKIPTPALVSRAISTRRAGVMVTGSHIPFDRNGIKINKSVGEVLKSDEAGITREVERVRTEEYSRTATTSAFDASGMLKWPLFACELPRGPPTNPFQSCPILDSNPCQVGIR